MLKPWIMNQWDIKCEVQPSGGDGSSITYWLSNTHFVIWGGKWKKKNPQGRADTYQRKLEGYVKLW